MTHLRWHRAFPVAAALIAGGAVSQATLTQLTTAATPHLDATISPEGNHVGYRVGNQALGSVSVVSGVETIVWTSASSTLTSFVWSTSSTTLFFADGTNVRAVGRSGGPSIGIGTVAGTSVSVSCLSPNGQQLFGTRQQLTNGHLFRLATDGQSAPVDIVSVVGVVDEVSIDRTGQFLVYRVTSGLPFTPVEFWRCDPTGAGQTLLYTDTVGVARGAQWLDDGQTFVIAALSTHVAQTHLGRVGPGGSLEMLTDYASITRRPKVRPGTAWILCENQTPDGLGISVGVMPVQGGGLVLVESGRPLWINAGSLNSLTGGISMDAADRRIAVSAGTSPTDPMAQIYIASLDREIELRPRPQTGSSFVLDLPLSAGEFGGVALAFGVSQTPITLPNLTSGFYLDPGFAVIVQMGVGTGAGPLRGTYPIPANPGLIGVRLFFQGARLDATNQGAFTRWGHFVVH